MVLENSLESPLDSKKIHPVHPKGNQLWIFIGRTDAEAEAAILWPPDAKSWLIGKDTDDGEDWGQQERGMTDIINSMDMSLSKFCEMVEDREARSAAVHGVAKSQPWLSYWMRTRILKNSWGDPWLELSPSSRNEYELVRHVSEPPWKHILQSVDDYNFSQQLELNEDQSQKHTTKSLSGSWSAQNVRDNKCLLLF